MNNDATDTTIKNDATVTTINTYATGYAFYNNIQELQL